MADRFPVTSRSATAWRDSRVDSGRAVATRPSGARQVVRVDGAVEPWPEGTLCGRTPWRVLGVAAAAACRSSSVDPGLAVSAGPPAGSTRLRVGRLVARSWAGFPRVRPGRVDRPLDSARLLHDRRSARRSHGASVRAVPARDRGRHRVSTSGPPTGGSFRDSARVDRGVADLHSVRRAHLWSYLGGSTGDTHAARLHGGGGAPMSEISRH